MDFRTIGYLRVGCLAPQVHIADPHTNAKVILENYETLAQQRCSLVLTPELSLTGYSCEDLFCNRQLLDDANEALLWLASKTKDCTLIVGFPFALPGSNQIYNCAMVCANQKIVGAVPKSALPNHGEYYEQRWFTTGRNVNINCTLGDSDFLLTTDQLFRIGAYGKMGIEVCEDLWTPTSPSTTHSTNGAEIICNLSASSEWIGKGQYRRELVRVHSAKNICAYLYASAGVFESTKDTVFSGHLIAAENGDLLEESNRFETSSATIVVDVDVDRLRFERKRSSTFPTTNFGTPAVVPTGEGHSLDSTIRKVDKNPFIPNQMSGTDGLAQDVINIQTAGLYRRMHSVGCEHLIIGLSGGLDSTLALLVSLNTLKLAKLTNQALVAITMPGHGTSSRTLKNVRQLVDTTGIELSTIDIREAVDTHLKMIGHEGEPDTTFENVQARERTKILFTLANQRNGIVIGTGDLSELALGWCTFNADHMSSYNVNVGVPKTMVRYIVEWLAHFGDDDNLKPILQRVFETPISPELITAHDDQILQETEAIIGPYEVHDFFLYHLLKTGATVKKLYLLACRAFADTHSEAQIKQYLKIFVDRFFRNQFKRSTVPPGPKVGAVSLSPRGDWRLPDEIEIQHWIDRIHEF